MLSYNQVAEAIESDVARVDAMQRNEGVEHVDAERTGLSAIERHALGEPRARDEAMNSIHHVELGADEARIGAMADHRRHERKGRF